MKIYKKIYSHGTIAIRQFVLWYSNLSCFVVFFNVIEKSAPATVDVFWSNCLTDFIFSWYNIMKHLVWTLLGITELEIFSTTESASDFLGTILYAIFIVVALVLLVNMMIAVLSHTYERVQVR